MLAGDENGIQPLFLVDDSICSSSTLSVYSFVLHRSCQHVHANPSCFCECLIEGSLEVKFPTIWTDEKQRWEESEKRRVEEIRSKKRKSQKKEDPSARKGRNVAKHCVFPMICGSGGSKSRLAKAAGAEPSGQMRDEKLHTVVAQSKFRSQNVQNIQTHTMLRPLLEVKMSKKCTPLWREGFGALLEVEMSKKSTPLWREAHFEVKMLKTHKNTRGWNHFWTFRCRFAWQAQRIVHLLKSEQNVRVSSISKNDGRRGTFEEDLQRCMSCCRRSTRDVSIRDVRR